MQVKRPSTSTSRPRWSLWSTEHPVYIGELDLYLCQFDRTSHCTMKSCYSNSHGIHAHVQSEDKLRMCYTVHCTMQEDGVHVLLIYKFHSAIMAPTMCSMQLSRMLSLNQAFLSECLEVLLLAVDIHGQTHREEDVDNLHRAGTVSNQCQPSPACWHTSPPLPTCMSSHTLPPSPPTHLQDHQSNAYPAQH